VGRRTEMSARSSVKRFLIVGVGGVILRVLLMTVRFRIHGDPHYQREERKRPPVLFAFWHSRLLPLVWNRRGEGAVVLVSRHRDGEYITRIIESLGFETERGSSTRGGMEGARGMLRSARKGKNLAITPDGPRGPAEVAKEGLLVLARLSGLPVVPLATAASRCWRLGSWDRFMIPKPFSTVHVVYGQPLKVPRDVPEDRNEAELARLEDALKEVTRQAEALARGEA
jgi:lysophospholipid acyltransferase (LPLAT)-like uncharacterized protein